MLKFYLLFFTHILSQMHSGVSRGPNMWHYNRLNTAADIRIQLSSIKPNIKEVYTNVKHQHPFHYVFVGEYTVIFFYLKGYLVDLQMFIF